MGDGREEREEEGTGTNQTGLRHQIFGSPTLRLEEEKRRGTWYGVYRFTYSWNKNLIK